MALIRLDVTPRNPKRFERVTITAVTTPPSGSCSYTISGSDDPVGNGSFSMANGIISGSTHFKELPPPGRAVPVPFGAEADGDVYTHPGRDEGEMRIVDVTHGEFPNHNTLSVVLLWTDAAGRDGDSPPRPFIIPGPDMTPENRAFNPKKADRSGRIKLSVKVPNLPEGGRIRWSVEPADQNGTVNPGTFTFAVDGGKTANVTTGERVEILARQPGLAAVDVEVRDSSDAKVESQKFSLCVPQFVAVDETVDFLFVLQRFGLADFKTEILIEAKTTCDHILSDANVRTIWVMPLFAEHLPGHLPGELFTRAHIEGDQPPGTKSHLLGRITDRNGKSTNVGPHDADEIIRVFPGTASTEFTDIADNVRALIEAVLVTTSRTTADTVRAVTVMGRLIGASLAHEIAHSLVGDSLDVPGDNFHTAVAGDILLPGAEWTFENMTGFGTTEEGFQDNGVESLNRPRAGGSLDAIELFFPVPTAFM